MTGSCHQSTGGIHIHAMHAGGRFGMNKLKKTRAFFSSADTNLEVWDQAKIYLQI